MKNNELIILALLGYLVFKEMNRDQGPQSVLKPSLTLPQHQAPTMVTPSSPQGDTGKKIGNIYPNYQFRYNAGIVSL